MHFNPSTTIQTFLVPNQKILFTCIMKVMRYQKKRKTQVNPTDVFEVYMDICQKYEIVSVYEGRFREALKMLEECGLIKINKGFQITEVLLGDYTLDEWESAMYLFPECTKLKDYIPVFKRKIGTNG